jgi:hypothetical protein
MNAKSLFLPTLIASASFFAGCSVRRPVMTMSPEEKQANMLCMVDKFMAKQESSGKPFEFFKPRGTEILTKEKLETTNKREHIRFIINAKDSVLSVLHGVRGANGVQVARHPIGPLKLLTGNAKELTQIGLNEFYMRKKSGPSLATNH